MSRSTNSEVRGLVTFTSRQSSTHFNASRRELARRGVELRLFRITHKFSRRMWRYWRVPLQDLHCLTSLTLRPYDFLLLNPGSGVMRRPVLLRLLLLIARMRGIQTYVRWGDCAWLLERKRDDQLGPKRFSAACRALSRTGIKHLTLSPPAARDLALVTGITSSHMILACNELPQAFRSPVVPDDPPVIVNVASVQERKGPDLFIEVAARVCREHPSVTFVWVGGEANESLARQIEEQGLRNRVRFVGHTSPPYGWMQQASVVFLSSRSEAFGLVAAEAMACYRTVCCFEDTGPEFAVGDTGIVVPKFDIALAAKRILEELDRPPSIRINQRAHERYQALFSPGPFAERLSFILRKPGAPTDDRLDVSATTARREAWE